MLELFIATLAAVATVHADPKPDSPPSVNVGFNEDKTMKMLDRIISKTAVQSELTYNKVCRYLSILPNV